MANTAKMRHQSISAYVKNSTTMSNTFLLFLHIFFAFFFYTNDTTYMFYVNLLSIATYLCGYIILYQNKSVLYSTIINAEVFIFMILATLCLGWEFGFQQYSIILVVSLLFTDYSINQEQHLTKSTLVVIALDLIAYFALRIWTYYNPHIYPIENVAWKRIVFLVNSGVMFSLLVSYSYAYSQTVFRLQRTLMDVATKDSLTGLFNRRKMHDLLNALSEVLSTTGNQICIAMIDIDNFKSINDTYGHDAGDEVLKSLSGILLNKQANEEGFQACRWGGEEFLILYRKDLGHDEIIEEFEELRRQVERQTIVYDNQKITFTVTTGLAFYRENVSITEMTKIADDNLYVGKTSGKNVVISTK